MELKERKKMRKGESGKLELVGQERNIPFFMKQPLGWDPTARTSDEMSVCLANVPGKAVE